MGHRFESCWAHHLSFLNDDSRSVAFCSGLAVLTRSSSSAPSGCAPWLKNHPTDGDTTPNFWGAVMAGSGALMDRPPICTLDSGPRTRFPCLISGQRNRAQRPARSSRSDRPKHRRTNFFNLCGRAVPCARNSSQILLNQQLETSSCVIWHGFTVACCT